MKTIFSLSFLFLFITAINAQTENYHSLLQKHVDKKGNVNYKSFKTDESKLGEYITYLQKTSPQKDWSDNKTKAFWINAYNAYTLKLILDNFPIKSITKIKKRGKDAWSIPFANVGGKNYTLNQIEHEILRKDFDDPRIHVGVNCASGSCPLLSNIAFTEKNIDSELERLMKLFINDPNRNRITAKKVYLSRIFEWYKGDFIKNGSLIDYLNKYSTTKINKKAKVRYLEYDWNLNGK
ncbi:MAG: DUF547 domain-containing protein [Flavobacteriaceae bacterium]|nr:DUF547 domain-containing protein [Flavobacteriaceae bacterium]